jgi:hypothetical protein
MMPAFALVLRNPKFALLLALCFAGSMMFYVQRILIPYQEADAAQHGRPRGSLSDLYPRWLGARELLLHGRDPYGPEVTREIQIGYYGRPLDPKRLDDPKDEERFAYPVYVVFLLAPTVTLPFPLLRTIFTWTLGVLTGISVLLWLRVLGWRPSSTGLAILLLLVMGSFATVQGIKLQQLSLFVAVLIALCATFLVSGQLFLAGLTLAVVSIKPQLMLLPAAWLLLWTLSNWRERQRFFWGFLLGGAVLAGAGEYVLPGWIHSFAHGLAEYERYTEAKSVLEALATPAGGKLLAVLFVVAAMAMCWRLRHAPAASESFSLALSLVLTVTVVVLPMVAPYNQLLLLPAVLLSVRSWNQLWQKMGPRRIACGVAVAIVFWPWVASFVLLLVSFFLAPALVQRTWAVPLWSMLGTPLAVLGLLALRLRDASENLRPESKGAA